MNAHKSFFLGVIALVFLLVTAAACGNSASVRVMETVTPRGAERATNSPSPTDTPLPTSTPRPTNTPRPTYTPRPTSTPTPRPEPIVLTGSGDSVVGFEKWKGPALAHIVYTGSGNFVVWNYGPDGEKIDLLVNTIGQYEGTRPLDFMDDDTVRFEVESSGQWKIEVLPLDHIRVEEVPGIIEGIGDDVVALIGKEPDLLKVDASSARSNFVIWGYGKGVDLLVNEVAPYSGTVVVSRDTFILVIEAEGPWTIEVTAR